MLQEIILKAWFIVLALGLVLFLSFSVLGQEQEHVSHPVKSYDTASWIARKVTGNNNGYLGADLFRKGIKMDTTNPKTWNRIKPGDIIVFPSTQKHSVEIKVANQAIKDVCSQQFSEHKDCVRRLAYQNRKDPNKLLSTVYVPIVYQREFQLKQVIDKVGETIHEYSSDHQVVVVYMGIPTPWYQQARILLLITACLILVFIISMYSVRRYVPSFKLEIRNIVPRYRRKLQEFNSELLEHLSVHLGGENIGSHFRVRPLLGVIEFSSPDDKFEKILDGINNVLPRFSSLQLRLIVDQWTGLGPLQLPRGQLKPYNLWNWSPHIISAQEKSVIEESMRTAAKTYVQQILTPLVRSSAEWNGSGEPEDAINSVAAYDYTCRAENKELVITFRFEAGQMFTKHEWEDVVQDSQSLPTDLGELRYERSNYDDSGKIVVYFHYHLNKNDVNNGRENNDARL